jgi:hypothetical protein
MAEIPWAAKNSSLSARDPHHMARMAQHSKAIKKGIAAARALKHSEPKNEKPDAESLADAVTERKKSRA